ncbi:hypothetical protein HMPREF0322_03159 [Desulfitobacterium hafniense DP7]|uniref:Uncharacterized protein n=1 Tax=Desulfitobacterium hafniense DP7 TaxID=537010 RepID=G9XQB3_DESHA|nr:hypothetical protein HMPREF0322_03159 [Desulfitobacterium hafniense DP7]
MDASRIAMSFGGKTGMSEIQAGSIHISLCTCTCFMHINPSNHSNLKKALFMICS